METESQLIEKNGELHEATAITLEGQTFVSGSGELTETRLAGYLKGPDEKIGDRGEVTLGSGRVIGTYEIMSRWATPRSWLSSHRVWVHIYVGDKVYGGSSCGSGMLVQARRLKRV